MGVSESTFDRWMKRVGGLGVPEFRQLQQRKGATGKVKRPDRRPVESPRRAASPDT